MFPSHDRCGQPHPTLVEELVQSISRKHARIGELGQEASIGRQTGIISTIYTPTTAISPTLPLAGRLREWLMDDGPNGFPFNRTIIANHTGWEVTDIATMLAPTESAVFMVCMQLVQKSFQDTENGTQVRSVRYIPIYAEASRIPEALVETEDHYGVQYFSINRMRS